MNRSALPSLRLNFGAALLGNLVYSGSQWLLLVALAKLGTPSQLGEYSLGLAYAVPIFQLASMNLRAVQATDRSGTTPFGAYLTTRVVTSVLATALTVVVALVAGVSRSTLFVVLLVAIVKAVDSLHDVVYGDLQSGENLTAIARSMSLRGVLSILFVVTVLDRVGSLPVALLGIAAISVPVLLLHDARRVRGGTRSSLRLRVTGLRQVFQVSAPLGLVAALDSLNVNVPKYVLQACRSIETVGSFSAIIALIMLGGVVLSALGNATLPRLATHWASGEYERFDGLLRRLLVFAAVTGAAGLALALVAGEWFLAAVYSPHVAAEAVTFVLVMGAAALWFVVTMLGFGLNAMRMFKEQIWIFGAMGVTTMLIALLIVPSHGGPGAAIAFGGGIAVRLLFSARLYLRTLAVARLGIERA